MSKHRDDVRSFPSASVAGLRLLAKLPRHPIVSVSMVVKFLDTTAPPAGKAAELLESLGILEEISGRQRDRVFSYARFLALLGAGMG